MVPALQRGQNSRTSAAASREQNASVDGDFAFGPQMMADPPQPHLPGPPERRPAARVFPMVEGRLVPMTTAPTIARALAAPARGKTFTSAAKRRRKQSQQRLEPSTQRARARRGQSWGTEARPVPVTGYRVMTPVPEHRVQVVLARQEKQVLV
jgi:hypothetical protein